MQLDRADRSYWSIVQFSNGLQCAVCGDGLLYLFEKFDIIPLLSNLPQDIDGWYFNETKDRYCAEWHSSGRIVVNPSKVYELFKEYPKHV